MKYYKRTSTQKHRRQKTKTRIRSQKTKTRRRNNRPTLSRRHRYTTRGSGYKFKTSPGLDLRYEIPHRKLSTRIKSRISNQYNAAKSGYLNPNENVDIMWVDSEPRSRLNKDKKFRKTFRLGQVVRRTSDSIKTVANPTLNKISNLTKNVASGTVSSIKNIARMPSNYIKDRRDRRERLQLYETPPRLIHNNGSNVNGPSAPPYQNGYGRRVKKM
jgi:hypothetical protein